MAEIERLEVISSFTAHSKFVDQFRLGAPLVSRRIDSHRNLTHLTKFQILSPAAEMMLYLVR
jgi:hypothetical protein